MSESSYRYLVKIYEDYTKNVKSIGPKNLADEMGVKRPTAYEYIQKLVNEGYLLKVGRFYSLTDKGIEKARRILRNHRIIETMLYRAGVELEEACKCASKIQCIVNDDVVEKICDYLGNPKKCPHGRPIPSDRG